MIYFVIFSLIAFFGLIEISGLRYINKNIFLVYGLAFIWMLYGLRWTTGADWKPYHDFFCKNETTSDFFNNKFEVGYTFLNYAVSIVWHNYTFFLLFFCGLYVYVNKLFITNFFQFYSVPLLYIFAVSGTIVRQSLAMAIVYFAYKYIVERNFFKFILLVLIAFTIHRSAIIILPFYFIVNRTYSNFFLIGFYLIGVYLSTTDYVIYFIIEMAKLIFGNVGGVVEDKLYVMLTTSAFVRSLTPFKILLSFINNAIWISLFLFFRKKISAITPSYDIFLNLYFISLFLTKVFNSSLMEFSRFANYFSGSLIILILMIFTFIDKKHRIIVYPFFVLFCLFKMIDILNVYPDLFFPYISIFSGSERFVY
jgi:hypothetical protein